MLTLCTQRSGIISNPVIKLEPDAEISSAGIHVLGRLRRIHRTDDHAVLTLDKVICAQQVVDLCAELAGIDKGNLKVVPKPCLADWAMTEDDLRPGVMQSCAARVLTKAPWLARLSKPDIYFVVARLASFVTRWTVWRDKVLHRLISYPRCSLRPLRCSSQ